MFKKLFVTVNSVLAVLMALFAGQALAATMETSTGAFQAIYGSPGTDLTALPVGGGLGRSFGFGENMTFEASTGAKVGENFAITLDGTVVEAKEAFLGGTLMSDKTGEDNPLGLAIEFADFQDAFVGGTAVPLYTDTADRPWRSEICSPASKACKTDAQFAGIGNVKMEDVSLDLTFGAGSSLVVQGWMWGKWENGAAGKAPCIKLEKPAAGNPTLTVTQTFAGGPVPGEQIEAIKGKACLISANSDWYRISAGEFKEPAITIGNS